MNVTGKHVLVAGASGGIGEAIAVELDRAGARLTLLARKAPALDALRGRLAGDHAVLAADISCAQDRESIHAHCAAAGLDVLVMAVGVQEFGMFEQQPAVAISAMVNTNLLAPMLLCHRLLPLLRERQEAAIVNIGSTFGSIGHPGFTAYCASKFGLRGFTEALQRELHDSTVRVSYLAPRATRTSLNSDAVMALNSALGNAVDAPEHVARALMEVLGNRRHQSFMGGPERLFVRLNSIFPGLVHGALARKLHIIRQHAGHHDRSKFP